MRRPRRPDFAFVSDDQEDVSHSQGLALGSAVVKHGARKGGRDLDDSLVGLYFDDRLIGFDGSPLRYQPSDDLRLGEALTDIRQTEFFRHQPSRVRRTPAMTRSTDGK